MATRIGGNRRKTRYKLKQSIRARGKVSIRKYFQKFTAGDHVSLVANPAVHKGMYHPRFHGRAGTINEASGECYTVNIVDQQKKKTLIVHPIHLRKLHNGKTNSPQ